MIFAAPTKGITSQETFRLKLVYRFTQLERLLWISTHSLSKRADAPVAVTDDPGRFVCNYTYYLNLTRCRINRQFGVFIHVPPFDAVSFQKLLDFVTTVVHRIHQHRIQPLPIPTVVSENLGAIGFSSEQITRVFLSVPLLLKGKMERARRNKSRTAKLPSCDGLPRPSS